MENNGKNVAKQTTVLTIKAVYTMIYRINSNRIKI